MAWEKWQQTAAQMKAERDALMRAMKKFLNQILSKAWNCWNGWAAEMRRQKYMLQGALTRMRNRLLSMAFEKWQDEAARAAREAFLLGGAMKRFMNRKLSQAWEKWQYEAELYKKNRQLLMNFVKRKMAMGFRAWRDVAAERRNQMFMMTGALNRMKLFKMSQAWEKWQYEYEFIKETERLAKLGMGIIRTAKVRAAWNKWRKVASQDRRWEALKRAQHATPAHQDWKPLDTEIAI